MKVWSLTSEPGVSDAGPVRMDGLLGPAQHVSNAEEFPHPQTATYFSPPQCHLALGVPQHVCVCWYDGEQEETVLGCERCCLYVEISPLFNFRFKGSEPMALEEANPSILLTIIFAHPWVCAPGSGSLEKRPRSRENKLRNNCG